MSLRFLLALGVASILGAQSVPHFLPPLSHLSGFGVTIYWNTAGDFNGDGRMDLAAPDPLATGSGFYYSLARAGGGYDAARLRVTGSFVQGMQAADFNLDGRTDLVLTTPAGAMVMLADTAGGFTGRAAAFPGIPNFIATGDFNRDGKADLAAALPSGFAVALGTGDGGFLPATLLPQLSTFYVITGDFNNDGNVDLAGPVGTGGVTYLGNGDGTFRAPVSTVNIPALSTVADFNNDGFPDLAYMTAQPRQDGSNHAISIARGVGNGQFQPYSNYVTGVPMSGIAAADYNADGRMDIATWISSTGKVRVFAGSGALTLGGDLLSDAPSTPNGVLIAADMDGNGSKDLVFSFANEFRLFRNTHGNPPLLAQLLVETPSVIGGAANPTATVRLGGVAPAGGAVIALSNGSSSLVSFPAGAFVTIPAGAQSASFAITTVAVAAASSADITASWQGVTQTARVDLVAPYTLTALTIEPGQQYGGQTAAGTVTLSGPADSTATVSLVSGNPALAAVPATATVPAGAVSVNFPITLSAVAADTPVAITASMGGISRSASLTVLRPADSVAISKAILTVKNAQLKVEATSTSAVATLSVYNPNTGALLGTLANSGGGKYGGTMFAPANLTRITVKSSLGGIFTGAIEVK
ncbi:MAG: VCBS repeat-containing protein [Bryobacterales bacterium]|nr:VCBS repeat-containing protein [Bryobacterales bacterium]